MCHWCCFTCLFFFVPHECASCNNMYALICACGGAALSAMLRQIFFLYHRHKAMLFVYVYVNSILFIHSLILSELIVLLIRCVCYEVKIKKKKMEKIFMKIKSMHPIYLFSFFFLIFCMSSSNR